MPYSNRVHENTVKYYITQKFKPETRILDIGAGAGYNYDMLKDVYSNIDGVEIYEPYVERFGLLEKYNNLFLENAVTFEKYGNYDLAIMGDVLEHLTVADSLTVLRKMREAGCDAIVQVPYLCKQGIWEGNVHEIHIQDDLTPDVMESRYGEYLTLVQVAEGIALYLSK